MLCLFTLCLVLSCYTILILEAGASDTNTGSVIVTANDRKLTYVTNLSANYDGEAIYTYEDGEEIHISCEIFDVLDLDNLRLEYYNAEGKLLVETNLGRTNQIFRSRLKSTNNKYYLDCIRASTNLIREYRYRTTFYLKNRDLKADFDDHAISFYINGQPLTVFNNNNKLFDDYFFRFIDGEVLYVSCRKTDDSIRGTLRLYGDYISTRHIVPDVWGWSRDNISMTMNMVMVASQYTNQMIFTCSISNSNIRKPNARLTLQSDVPGNEVRVRGLLRDNILYQYANGLDQWIIEYQYSVNDILNLTCVTKGSPVFKHQLFQWEFNDVTSNSSVHLFHNFIIETENKFSKVLNATENGKKLKCVYISNSSLKKTVEIILRLNPELEAGEIISGERLSGSDNKTLPLVLGGSIGAVLVVLVVTGAFYCFRRARNAKRHIETSNEEFTNYDNLYEVPAESHHRYDPNQHINNTSERLENNYQEEHAYEYIDTYFKHRPSETQTRNSLVYDEPFVQYP